MLEKSILFSIFVVIFLNLIWDFVGPVDRGAKVSLVGP
jgi:hypothetical protein